jgi:protein gp37
MGRTTKVEWADATFNPWIGCTKVSPACDHCYAEIYGRRFGVKWGPGQPRRRTSAANWRQPILWDRASERDGVRRSVFCASLADVFDDEIPVDWRHELFYLIQQCDWLDWLLLTKRPEKVPLLAPYMGPWPKNIWLGVTAENQEQADKRIPILLSIPAAVRFVSVEPMLGAITLPLTRPCEMCGGSMSVPCDGGGKPCPRCFTPTVQGADPNQINWVICGAETGPGARPMDPTCARGLRDQCRAAGVPFFYKRGSDGSSLLDGREWRETP